MIITIVGAGRLAEGIAVRALAGGCTLRLADAEPGKADALAGRLRARLPPAGPGQPRPGPPLPGGGVEAAAGLPGLAGLLAGADVVVLAVPYPQGRLVASEQGAALARSEEHTSELQSRPHLVCRL